MSPSGCCAALVKKRSGVNHRSAAWVAPKRAGCDEVAPTPSTSGRQNRVAHPLGVGHCLAKVSGFWSHGDGDRRPRTRMTDSDSSKRAAPLRLASTALGLAPTSSGQDLTTFKVLPATLGLDSTKFGPASTKFGPISLNLTKAKLVSNTSATGSTILVPGVRPKSGQSRPNMG